MRALGSRTLESLESLGGALESTVADTALSTQKVDELATAVETDPRQTVLILDVLGTESLRGKTEKQIVQEGTSLVRTAQGALTQIAKKGAQAALDEEQLSALEAIIRLTGRPSFLIKRGDYPGPIEKPWQQLALDVYRTKIKKTIQSVGRVYMQLKGEGRTAIGTAWVGAPGVMVTNRHVASFFAGKKAGSGAALPAGGRAWVDMLVEEGNPKTRVFEVNRILHIEKPDSPFDLALLEVETKNSASEALPSPLAISPSDGDIKQDDQVYTVGYPGQAEARDVEALEQIFGGIFNRKRLAPGIVTELDASTGTLLHDCSTLGGSSGSCVVRLATHMVIGLHFKGAELVTNEAVLMATLAAQKRLKKFGLNFVE